MRAPSSRVVRVFLDAAGSVLCSLVDCNLLTLIVLLRVFMAMLTTTFNAVNKDARLRWRLQFARHILQHELIAIRTGGATKAGEEIDGQSYYIFKAYLDIDAKRPVRRLSATPAVDKPSATASPSLPPSLETSTSPPDRSTISSHRLLA